jgi:glutamyl-tRNA synthetase
VVADSARDAQPPISPEAEASIERNALLNASKHDGTAEAGAVISRVLGEFPELRSRAPEVAREVQAIVKRINALSASDQASLLRQKYPGSDQPKEREAGRIGLPPLPNAVRGRATFRLPPEPSGFMHIGHAMAFNVNFLYKEMYDGQLWLRFEDTNPKKAIKRYYESFRRGIAWLGIKCDHEKNVSEDLETIYSVGETLLREGKAYACSCSQETVKKLRFDGTPCEHRGNAIEANIRVWEGLLAKEFREGSYVIRLKGDMANLDYSLRDPNIFRVIEHVHPVTGTRYTLWPTYDLANTVEDEICGVTHILRSSEFHTALQQLIREMLSYRKVEVIQFSRYNFKGTPVHKRLLRPLVEEKLVSGWDDPRMPTVDGIRRRGILPEAIRQFTLQVSYTKTEHEYDWSLLFAVNRKLLDPVSKRIFFVPDPVKLTVENMPERASSGKTSVTLPFHPEKDLGERTIEVGNEFHVPRSDIESLHEGTVFRLMDLYNVELLAGGSDARARYAGDELIPDTRKIQWVTTDNRPVRVIVPGTLFDEGGQFDPASLKETQGLAEAAFSDLAPGEIVQFPRFGFCRLDSPGTAIMAHK